MKKKWLLIFSCILLLTQFVGIIEFGTDLFFLGFPKWLYYLCGIHLLFVGLLYYYFEDNKSGESL